MDYIMSKDTRSGVVIGYLSFILSCLLPKWQLKPPAFHKKTDDKTGTELLRGRAEIIETGSNEDGLAFPDYMDRSTKLSFSSPDIDAMMISDHIPGIPFQETYAEDKSNMKYLHVDNSDTMPGFLRIRKHESGTQTDKGQYMSVEPLIQAFRESEVAQRKGKSIRDPKVFPYTKQETSEVKRTGSVITLTTDGPANTYFNFDILWAMKYEWWPEPAMEWISRMRPGWPHAHLVHDIVKEGCYIVPKAHPYSRRCSVEFCYSFTVAERRLALSFTANQRRCYILLKLLISHMVGNQSLPSSYQLKNVFFWMMERVPKSVWEDNTTGLAVSFLAVLDELIYCFAQQNLPQYFVRKNNLLDGKPRDHIKTALQMLKKLRKFPLTQVISFDRKYKLREYILCPNLSGVLNTMLVYNKDAVSFLVYSCHKLYIYTKMIHFFATANRSEDFSCTLREAVEVREQIQITGNTIEKTEREIEEVLEMNILGSAITFTGIAWCLFVHCINMGWDKCDEAWPALRSKVRKVFRDALEQGRLSDWQRHHPICYFALFLYKTNQLDEMIAFLEGSQHLLRCENKSMLLFTKFDVIGLDDCLLRGMSECIGHLLSFACSRLFDDQSHGQDTSHANSIHRTMQRIGIQRKI